MLDVKKKAELLPSLSLFVFTEIGIVRREFILKKQSPWYVCKPVLVEYPSTLSWLLN